MKRIKTVSELFIVLISVFGLTYQTSQLCLKYMSGQTVVSIKVDKIGFTEMPAITICYPSFTSLEKLANIYSELKKDYEIYSEIIKYSVKFDAENKTVTKIFNDMKEKFLNFSLKALKSMPLHEAFENISLPFTQLIKAIAVVKIYNDLEGEYELSRIMDKSPIESITFKHYKDYRKCFTYFSQFNNQFKNLQIEVDHFRIPFNYKAELFPQNLQDAYHYFSIHSPKAFPHFGSEDNYIRLSIHETYTISYSRIITKLLPPNYSTNCRNYNISNIHEEQSRSDCIDRCILKLFREKCGKYFYPTELLLRKEYIQMYSPEKLFYDKNLTECYNMFFAKKVQSKCVANCRPDCHNQFIDFQIRDVVKTKTNERSYISITHNRLPDLVIEHLPEMTFLSFICNFGGLTGMWLGLSVTSLFKLMTSYLNKIGLYFS